MCVGVVLFWVCVGVGVWSTMRGCVCCCVCEECCCVCVCGVRIHAGTTPIYTPCAIHTLCRRFPYVTHRFANTIYINDTDRTSNNRYMYTYIPACTYTHTLSALFYPSGLGPAPDWPLSPHHRRDARPLLLSTTLYTTVPR